MKAAFADLGAHGRVFAQNTVGRHPVAAGWLIALLVVLVVVMIGAAKKDHFGVTPYHNLMTGCNSPLWHLGNDDAGWGGPVHRESTKYHVATVLPGWRAGSVHPTFTTGGREGLAAGPVSPAGDPCPGPIYNQQVVQGPDGMMHVQCVQTDVGPLQTCAPGWDPSATYQAAALAATGGLDHRPFAEGALQTGIDAAYDSTPHLSDAQLNGLMHNGGAY